MVDFEQIGQINLQEELSEQQSSDFCQTFLSQKHILTALPNNILDFSFRNDQSLKFESAGPCHAKERQLGSLNCLKESVKDYFCSNQSPCAEKQNHEVKVNAAVWQPCCSLLRLLLPLQSLLKLVSVGLKSCSNFQASLELEKTLNCTDCFKLFRPRTFL